MSKTRSNVSLRTLATRSSPKSSSAIKSKLISCFPSSGFPFSSPAVAAHRGASLGQPNSTAPVVAEGSVAAKCDDGGDGGGGGDDRGEVDVAIVRCSPLILHHIVHSAGVKWRLRSSSRAFFAAPRALHRTKTQDGCRYPLPFLVEEEAPRGVDGSNVVSSRRFSLLCKLMTCS